MMHQSGRPQWRTIAVATPSPGGGLPVFARWRRIFLTSSGSVIIARILMGEPQRPQTIGSTSYTFAIRRAHATLRSAEQTERSGSWFSCVS